MHGQCTRDTGHQGQADGERGVDDGDAQRREHSRIRHHLGVVRQADELIPVDVQQPRIGEAQVELVEHRPDHQTQQVEGRGGHQHVRRAPG